MPILLTDTSISNGVLSAEKIFVTDDGVIRAVFEMSQMEEAQAFAKDPTIYDLRGWTTTPGFIDIHTHGGGGYDVMDGTYEAVNALSMHKVKEGVTAFCPTTITAPLDKTEAAIEAVAEGAAKGVAGAKIIGAFLEGPYINPKNKGAHIEAYIRPVSRDELETLLAAGRGYVASVAISPELPGAAEVIPWLCARGVNVRIGHSSAGLDETNASIALGGNIAIHTYNCIGVFNHRTPGMIGAVLTNPAVYAELICDLVHVHPAAVKILVNSKGADKIILVTDCMRAGGLPDGAYDLGDMPVMVRDGIARTPDGALAGSTATLAACVWHMYKGVGVPLTEAVQMATATPARALGISGAIGTLEPGKRADFTALDDDGKVRFVMVDGVVRYTY